MRLRKYFAVLVIMILCAFTLQPKDVIHNWAGYVVYTKQNDSPLVSIQGSWTVPKVWRGLQYSHFYSEYSMAWIGIGGRGNDEANQAIIQIGTSAVAYPKGKPFNFSWWEDYPTNYIHVIRQRVDVGDKMTARMY